MERTLLLVDDEENIIRSLRRLLRRDGYHIFSANSGEQGIEIVKNENVNVIISDQRMPGMTGVEFLKTIKASKPEIVRIILSGYTDLDTVTNAVNEGSIYKFVTKPWEEESLREVIRQAFDKYDLLMENARLQNELKRVNEELVYANRELEQRVKTTTRSSEISTSSLRIAQEIIEQIDVGILGVDDNGTIVVDNKAARNYLSDGEATLVGMNVHVINIPKFANILQSTLKDVVVEIQRKSDAKKYMVSCQAFDKGGVIEGKVLILKPIIS